jgi:DNA mismatch endonuclease, patch repair protein
VHDLGGPRAAPPSAERSRIMSGIRRRDTGPEVALRRELHARGLRFRVHLPVPPAPRRSIDIALTRARIAVFVDGCFWHSCEEHLHMPRNNREWWRWKLSTVADRDRNTDGLLRSSGWTVVRCWEHEVASDSADRIQELWETALRARPAQPGPNQGQPPVDSFTL